MAGEEHEEEEPVPEPPRLTVNEVDAGFVEGGFVIAEGETPVAVIPPDVPNGRELADLLAAAPTLLWALRLAEVYLKNETPLESRDTPAAQKIMAVLEYATALTKGGAT